MMPLICAILFSPYVSLVNSDLIPNKPSSTSDSFDRVEQIIVENITVYGPSYCSFSLEMTIPGSSSQLIDGIKDALGFHGIPLPPERTPLPETYLAQYAVSMGTGVTEKSFAITQPTIYARAQFEDTIKQEQELSLGIHITNMDEVALAGVGSDCVIWMDGEALLQNIGSGFLVGPGSLDASYARAGFILNKISFIQQMLGSFGKELYDGMWITQFVLPENTMIVNYVDLLGKEWVMDFGGGNYISANLTIIGPRRLVLTERLQVTNQEITKSPADLLEAGFLCYKVFNVVFYYIYWPSSAYDVHTAEIEANGSLPKDWSYEWNYVIWDGSWDLNLASGVVLSLSSYAKLKGYIGWDHEWFHLKWFQAYMELTASVDIDLTIDYSSIYTSDPQNIVTLKVTYSFMVGPVPVWADLVFTADASLEVNAPAKLSCGVEATGQLKFGVGWKNNRGWYPILDTQMNTDSYTPTISCTSVTITPSVKCRLSFMFYSVVGPYIDFIPYATLQIWTIDNWEITVGLKVDAGITFADWLKKILGLNDYNWPICDLVFWKFPPTLDYNVAVIGIRSQDTGFVTETIPIYVDILNKGKENVNVDAFLYYFDGYHWQTIGSSTINNLQKGDVSTLTFQWPTASLTNRLYPMYAQASIQGHTDQNQTDNWRGHGIRLEVRNVAVTHVSFYPDDKIMFPGQTVEIYVHVKNLGTIPVDVIEVSVYYDSTPISSVWCEAIHWAFNLGVDEQENFIFSWKIGVWSGGRHYIYAKAALLPYETDSNDNIRHSDKTIYIFMIPAFRRGCGGCIGFSAGMYARML